MTWKTHMVGGMAAAASVTVLYSELSKTPVPPDTWIPFVTISGISALLPDVDEIRSKAGKLLLPVSLIFFIMQCLVKVVTFFTFGKLRRKIEENTRFMMHRGVCHYLTTLLFFVCGGIIGAIIFAEDLLKCLVIIGAFAIGYLSHIGILDIISGKIALLAPFSKKRFGICLVKSGSLLETLVVRPGLLFVTIILCLRL